MSALLPNLKKDHEDNEVSDRFIKERGMDGRQGNQLGAESCKIRLYRSAPHAPGCSCRGSESFLVEEVAPTADSLAQRKIDDAVIDKRSKRYLADPAHEKESQERKDDAAVYGKAAGPCIEYALEIVLVDVPVEYYVVSTGTDYGAGYRYEHRVIDERIREVILLCLLDRQCNAEYECRRDKYTVPVDLEIADAESYRIDVKLQSESGKLDFFVI